MMTTSSSHWDIRLCVIEAKDVPNVYDPSAGVPFAYAKIKWNGQKYKTETDKTHQWNQEFKLSWRKGKDPSTLQVEVWISYAGKNGRHTALGYVPIDLQSLRLNTISCASYGLLKCKSCPSYGNSSPMLKLQIQLIDPSQAVLQQVGSTNLLPKPRDIPTTARDGLQQMSDMREFSSQLIERIAADNPSASKLEIELALHRANFDPDLALQCLAEIMVTSLTTEDGMNNTTSTRQSASVTPTPTDHASVLSSYSSSSYSSSSSSSTSALSADEHDDGFMTVNSREEKDQYDEMKKLAKIGDRGAKQWVKNRKKEKKKQKQNESSRAAAESGKSAKARKRTEEKHSSGSCPASSLLPSELEAKLKELFPYFSVEQIVKVLVKHNNKADPALNELLDTRFDEVGQTATAQVLSATISVAQESEELGQTFVDFLPVADDKLPAAKLGYGSPPKLGFGSPPKVVAPIPPRFPVGAPTAQVDDVAVPSGKRKALLIGIDYIGTNKRLRGCIEDSKQIRKLLTSTYGFPDNDYAITMLNDDNPKRCFQPTKRNILAAFQWLVDGAVPGTLLFLHYSGHGSQQINKSGTEKDGLDETILPSDFATNGIITDNDINRALVAPLKKGVKFVCLMDCCHAGSAMDLPFVWNVERRRWDIEVHPQYGEGDVQLLSGCMDDQTSAEFYLSHQECGGAMTKALRQSLALNPFGHTYGTLIESIARFLRTWGFRQNPTLSSTRKLAPDQPFGLNPVAPNANHEAFGKVGNLQALRPPWASPAGVLYHQNATPMESPSDVKNPPYKLAGELPVQYPYPQIIRPLIHPQGLVNYSPLAPRLHPQHQIYSQPAPQPQRD